MRTRTKAHARTHIKWKVEVMIMVGLSEPRTFLAEGDEKDQRRAVAVMQWKETRESWPE